ncbi:MAG TPA: zf-HC2 domain-containing protein [Candidatus Obscuribacterales bacterium]
MSNTTSDCEKFVLLLDAYRDGELDGDEKQNVATHVEQCGACQDRLAEIDFVANSLRNLPRVAPRRDFAEGIEKLVAPQKSSPKVVPLRKPTVIWTSLAAAAAAIALVVVAGRSLVAPPAAVVSVKPNEAPGIKSDGRQESPQVGERLTVVAEKSAANKRGPVDAAPQKSVPKGTKQKADRAPESVVAQNPARQTRTDEQGMPKTVAGQNPAVAQTGGNNMGPGSAEGVAVYVFEGRPVSEELGITTDEDGLYALKL